MCAIIGFEVGTPEKHENNVVKYFTTLQERGDQSFGYLSMEPDGIIYYCKSLQLSGLIESIESSPKGTWIYMHARKASYGMTGGTVDEQLEKAHPVKSDNEEVLLLHNGTKSEIHDTVQGSISDSQGLATLLSLMPNEKAYSLLSGDLGVVVYNKNGKVYLYKDGCRPLVMAETKTIFASEPLFDTVKWHNIAPTVGIDKFSVELKPTEDSLGLTLGKATTVKFNIAQHTVKNFTTKGMPKSSTCNLCKKMHLENINGMEPCCTCAIEGRVPLKVVKTTPKVTYSTPKATNSTSSAKAVLHRSTNTLPQKGESELFISDITMLRTLGYSHDDVKWVGWAKVKANLVYKNEDGSLFVEPRATGSIIVKTDRVIVKNKMKKVGNTKHDITTTVVKHLGRLDMSTIFVPKRGVDISTGAKNVAIDNSYYAIISKTGNMNVGYSYLTETN